MHRHVARLERDPRTALRHVEGVRDAEDASLERYVEVIAHVDTEAETRLVPVYRLDP
jgi:hypothetical protein